MVYNGNAHTGLDPEDPPAGAWILRILRGSESTVIYNANAPMKALWLQSRAFLASGSWIRRILPRDRSRAPSQG